MQLPFSKTIRRSALATAHFTWRGNEAPMIYTLCRNREAEARELLDGMLREDGAEERGEKA
jgi:hypothetical protein